MLLLREMGLLGGELVAIDGAFFHGDASKGSIVTRHRLSETVVAVERDIEAYTASLETNDRAEDQAAPAEGLAEKLAALKEKHAELTAGLARLAESGETQLSRTDADARLLSKRGQTIAGYNVQIAVDDRHKLIVASEVVNDGNDTGQLHAMAVAAKEALGVETLQAAADTGYFNGETLKACEADAIVAYVPEPDRTGATAAQGRFSVKDFTYDAAADIYRCPAGAELRRMRGYKLDAAGKLQIRYASRGSVCKVCPLRQQCLTPKARRRDVYRWEHQEVVERHRVRMAQPEASEMMSHRASLVEHPFGTLKCRAGYRHFLLRGFTFATPTLHKPRAQIPERRLVDGAGGEVDALLEILGADEGIERAPGSIVPEAHGFAGVASGADHHPLQFAEQRALERELLGRRARSEIEVLQVEDAPAVP